MTILWGIDLGGTKIEGAVFEAQSPEKPLARIRIQTEAEKGYRHIIDRIALLIEKLKSSSGHTPQRIGFSTPGALDPTSGTMKNCNTTCLNGKALDRDLTERLGIPIETQNDANCFALTEATLGAGKDAAVVFGVIMGTGVGGGIVVNRQIIGGAQGIAGEWGHNIIDPDGPECYCGRKGCVETLLAGPKIEQYYQRISHHHLSLAEIAERAKSGGDIHATETIEYLTSLFARSIAQVINILDPSVIVLGGGVSNVEQLYSQATREKIGKQIFNTGFKTPLLKNQLGDSAGVFGAGYLCLTKN